VLLQHSAKTTTIAENLVISQFYDIIFECLRHFTGSILWTIKCMMQKPIHVSGNDSWNKRSYCTSCL